MESRGTAVFITRSVAIGEIGRRGIKFTPEGADGHERMFRPSPPMSNAERQAQFRASHPGYFKKYRISMKQVRARMQLRATLEAAAAQQRSEFPETLFDLVPAPLPEAA